MSWISFYHILEILRKISYAIADIITNIYILSLKLNLEVTYEVKVRHFDISDIFHCDVIILTSSKLLRNPSGLQIVIPVHNWFRADIVSLFEP